MTLSKSKYWYSNNCSHFSKCAALLGTWSSQIWYLWALNFVDHNRTLVKNKSSLLLKTIFKLAKILQLFTNIKNRKTFIKVFYAKHDGLGLEHRYRKSKIDCSRFVMCPLLALVFQGFFSLFCSDIVKAQKSILTVWFLTVISRHFTVLVLDHQYQVLDRIVLESICLNLSRYQIFDAYFSQTH